MATAHPTPRPSPDADTAGSPDHAAGPAAALLAGCHELLAAGTEGAQARLARSLLAGYAALDPPGRLAFLQGLSRPMDPDPAAVLAAAESWRGSQTTAHLADLLRAAKPPRRDLLRRLHLAPGATRALVRLRQDLLGLVDDHPELARVDLDLRFLLRDWFTRQFLELRRIDWSTPALVLERIATNEAVHEVSGWLDLRARVRPSDRRCYGFFHPAMPDEPLIFVMVALTEGLPGTIGAVLETDRTPLPAATATTAVFYSISNCQPGLRGVSLGSFLIKQVAATISADLPGVDAFLTLSPITGLARWMEARGGADGSDGGAVAPDPDRLAALAARYLLTARREDGQPLDPVARFHLGNGASLDRIIPGADTSPRGLQRAHGVMASYRYDLDAVEANHDAYVTRGEIVHGDAVRRLG